MSSVRFIAERANMAAKHIAMLSFETKKEILQKIANRIEENAAAILTANKKDLTAGKRNRLSEGLLDRLILTKERLSAIAADVRKIAGLKDYVGEIIESRELKNGLQLKRVRVPIGVIGMIYEARPNVTVDAATLCMKSGNAVILRGGSDAINSNRELARVIREVLAEESFLTPETGIKDAVTLIESTDRKTVTEMLQMTGLIDVIIPRGGTGLIKFVRKNSRVPVIETGASTVHTYVDRDADINKAVKIILNAKLRRVSICNTLDSLLLHKDIAEKFLASFATALPGNSYVVKKLELRADSFSFNILRAMKKPKNFALAVKKAAANDYHAEFLDYILAVKTVRTLDEAIEHIDRHSLGHSEAIITENRATAERFLNEVDSACVYWNASTQFSDGGEFGLGAEIGISTQKLHARGPFALEGLTSYKWIIEGNGQIRQP